MTHIK